ncbi:MAG: hypothetical protein CL570_03365 [Alphaproteobacteria bacterium]|nr:hypothetical protein [Alphaproteobacteria bacterium]HCQ71316.1 hypothetical protein [Rhodospirillaceae bacterium]
MGNQFLSLGLFIMLLSFFIVLNSLSTFEESKTRAVIDSLSDALVPQYSFQEDMPSPVIANEGEDANKGDALEQIKALFNASIPDVKAQKNRFGTELRMKMARADFEQALVGAGPDGQRFSAALAGLMDLDDSVPYEMDIVLNIDANPAALQGRAPSVAGELINAAGRYAQTLEDQGVRSRLITTGLAHGDDDQVFLLFRRYMPVRLELRTEASANGG